MRFCVCVTHIFNSVGAYLSLVKWGHADHSSQELLGLDPRLKMFFVINYYHEMYRLNAVNVFLPGTVGVWLSTRQNDQNTEPESE